VDADGLHQIGLANRHRDGLVDDAGVHMMAMGNASTRVNGEMPGREDRRPTPFLGGMRGFPSQRIREGGLAMPLSQALLMPRLDPGQVLLDG
jgi:hypothetical protein